MFLGFDAYGLILVEHFGQHVHRRQVAEMGQPDCRVVTHVGISVFEHEVQLVDERWSTDDAHRDGRCYPRSMIRVARRLDERLLQFFVLDEPRVACVEIVGQQGDAFDRGAAHVGLAVVTLGRGGFDQRGQAVVDAKLTQRTSEIDPQRDRTLVHAAGFDFLVEDAGQLLGQLFVEHQFRSAGGSFRSQREGQVEGGLPTGFVVARQGPHVRVPIVAHVRQPIEHQPDHHHDHDNHAGHDEQLHDESGAGGFNGRKRIVGRESLGRRHR